MLLGAPLLSGCAVDPAQREFERAERLLSEGSYREAIDQYSYVVSRFGGSAYAPRSQYKIGVIYDRNLSDEKKALNAYSALFFMYPASAEAALARHDVAKIYSRKGEYRKAVEEYQKLLEERPGEQEKVQYLIAMEYVKMNDFRQARIELTELLDKVSNPAVAPKILFQIANTYYIEGKMQKALSGYDEIISKYPETDAAIDARFGKAKALDEEGRLEEALSILRGLEGQYPNSEALNKSIELIEKRLKENQGQKKERKHGAVNGSGCRKLGHNPC